MDAHLLALQSAAVTVILTKSSLFAPLRDHGPAGWRRFSSCQLCVGFWVGATLAAVDLYSAWKLSDAIPPRTLWPAMAVDILGLGALGGAVALLYVAALDFLDAVATTADKLRLPAGSSFSAEEIPTAPGKKRKDE